MLVSKTVGGLMSVMVEALNSAWAEMTSMVSLKMVVLGWMGEDMLL